MTLIEHLRAGENDPMWADHCEMPKRIAKAAADEIERLRDQLADCQTSLSIFDDGRVSEYWMRHGSDRETARMITDGDPLNYPASFEEFWRLYPTDPLMSKKKTYEQWRRLTAPDRLSAKQACQHFRDFCRSHPTYRPVHAWRFLAERRFDGFAPATS